MALNQGELKLMKKHVTCTWWGGGGGERDLVSAVYKNCSKKKKYINKQNNFITNGKMAHECRPGIIRKISVEPNTLLGTQFSMTTGKMAHECRPSIVRKTSIEPNTSLGTQFLMNPLTPVSDQDRIFPYDMNTLSSRQAMRINKNIN